MSDQKPELPELEGEVVFRGCRRYLGEQPERVLNRGIIACVAHLLLCRHGRCCSNILDVSSRPNKIDHLTPPARSRQCTQVLMAHGRHSHDPAGIDLEMRLA